MKKTIAKLIFIITFLMTQSAYSLEPSLRLQIDSLTKEFTEPERFVLIVEIHNTSSEAVVVFPVYISRNFQPLEGQNARFNKYPGPVVDPWPTAILLNAGERKKISLSGIKKPGAGVWRLEHGSYNLSVSMHVAPTSTFGVGNREGKLMNSTIWRGAVESNSITIRYYERE